MAGRFDRQRLFSNISALIQQRGYKVGELEARIGVSQGYLSRLIRGENTPSAELIWKLAKLLDINMEILIDGDFSQLAPNVEYLQKFVRKLLQDTMKGDLTWTSTSIDEINASLMGGSEHIPIVWETDYEGTMDDREALIAFGYLKGSEASCGSRCIGSFTRPKSSVIAADSFFYTDLEEKQRLYVFKFAELVYNERSHTHKPIEWYELVFRSEMDKEYKYEPLTNTFSECPPLHADVEALYQELKHHEGDLILTDSARSIIDGFMKRPKPQRGSGIQVIDPGIKI